MSSETVMAGDDNKQCGGYGCCGQSKPARTPARLCGGLKVIESGAHVRKQRTRDLSVGGSMKTRIDCGEEGLFFGEGFAAGGAFGKMSPQFTLRRGPGSSRVD